MLIAILIVLTLILIKLHLIQTALSIMSRNQIHQMEQQYNINRGINRQPYVKEH